jgi:23S rRNA (uracil1939-C5)-methyltransferase
MGRKRNRYPKLENVEIVDAGAEGKAVGKVDERVVFVPWAVPGDVVDVQVVKKKKSYYEGRIIAIGIVFFYNYYARRVFVYE